jgi:16S rRNA (cytosine967-C5)-methyltransferase
VKRLSGKIDRVLVDAPCSGLGTLRRNPDLKWRQSPKALAELQAKQQAILASAARLLKPGGRLVYATCSLLQAENEAVADAFTAERAADFAPVPAAEALSAAHVGSAEQLVSGAYLRLWPHRHQTDGFFAAVWQRR